MAGTKAPRRKTLSHKAIRKGLEKKERQTFIAGTEPPRIPEIERAAGKYVDIREQRMGLTEEEAELKTTLIDAMKQFQLTEYNFDGYMVELSHIDEDQVKVKKARAAKQNGELA